MALWVHLTYRFESSVTVHAISSDIKPPLSHSEIKLQTQVWKANQLPSFSFICSSFHLETIGTHQSFSKEVAHFFFFFLGACAAGRNIKSFVVLLFSRITEPASPQEGIFAALQAFKDMKPQQNGSKNICHQIPL